MVSCVSSELHRFFFLDNRDRASAVGARTIPPEDAGAPYEPRHVGAELAAALRDRHAAFGVVVQRSALPMGRPLR